MAYFAEGIPMTDLEREAIKAFLLDVGCLRQLDKWKNQYMLTEIC